MVHEFIGYRVPTMHILLYTANKLSQEFLFKWQFCHCSCHTRLWVIVQNHDTSCEHFRSCLHWMQKHFVAETMAPWGTLLLALHICHYLFYFHIRLLVAVSFGWGEVWHFHWEDYDFSSGSKSRSIAKVLQQSFFLTLCKLMWNFLNDLRFSSVFHYVLLRIQNSIVFKGTWFFVDILQMKLDVIAKKNIHHTQCTVKKQNRIILTRRKRCFYWTKPL